MLNTPNATNLQKDFYRQYEKNNARKNQQLPANTPTSAHSSGQLTG
jgi:hypothetical protein